MLIYDINKSTESEVFVHLNKCKNTFIPPLDSTVDIKVYSKKLYDFSIRFEAWDQNELVGLIAAYFNDEKFYKGFITNVSVLDSYRGKGIAQSLIENCIRYAKKYQFSRIELEVYNKNIAAISLYKKYGFQIVEQIKDIIKMQFV